MIAFLKLLWLAIQWGPTVITLVQEIIALIQKLPGRDQGLKTLDLSETMNSVSSTTRADRIRRLAALKKDLQILVSRHEKSR